MEAFAPLKLISLDFLHGESLVSSDENIELHYKLKIDQEKGRFNRAITTVADVALDSDGCLGLF